MLTITVGDEGFNEKTSEFVLLNPVVLQLEHSLVSLSKWESKFEKPYLGAGEKTDEEAFGYIEAMILTPDFPPGVSARMTQANIDMISLYLNSKQSATTFVEANNNPQSREVITSELIYYWMTVFSIPFECENWYLNRLLTLIRVCNVKQEKPKRMGKQSLADRRALNEQRRREHNTTG